MTDHRSRAPEEWIAELAAALELEAPSPAETEELLQLASIAAHASERRAAPIACWLAGRSGRPAGELLEASKRISPDE